MKNFDEVIDFAAIALAGVFVFLTAVFFAGCLHTDRVMVLTEAGVRAAEAQWDAHYYQVLKSCSDRFPAGTEEAKTCFGPTYEANKKTEAAVITVVTALRLYWTARAAGEDPDWKRTAAQIASVVGDLPPDVRQYFERVQGIK